MQKQTGEGLMYEMSLQILRKEKEERSQKSEKLLHAQNKKGTSKKRC